MVTTTKIVNVVATASLNQELYLHELGKLRNILHDSEIYGGRVAYFKSSNMEGKVSIFTSGKMISVGTTSEEVAINELEQTKRFLVENHMLTKATKLRARALFPKYRFLDLRRRIFIKKHLRPLKISRFKKSTQQQTVEE